MDYDYSSSISGAGAAIWSLLVIAFYVLVVIGLWKTFVKAGHPGWAAIIPFYNLWIWIKIAGRPVSWFWIMLVGALLAWIPIIGWLLLIAIWVMSLFLALDVSRNFGQGTGFGVLLWLFAPIMYLVLGFGSFPYRQVAHPEAGMGGGYSGGGYASPPPPPPSSQPAQSMGAQPLVPPPPPPPLSAPPAAEAAPAQVAPPAQATPPVVPPVAEAAPQVAEAAPPAASEAPIVPPAAPEPPVTPPEPPASSTT